MNVIPIGEKVRRAREDKGLTQDRLSERADVSHRTVQNIEASKPVQQRILELVAKALGKPVDYFLRRVGSGSLVIPAGLEKHWVSSESTIKDRLDGFVGREFLFKELENLLDDPNVPSGYFLIEGEPGIGKTSFMAQLVSRMKIEVHHFNSALQGVTSVRKCLGNLATRLIARYELPYSELPTDFEQDGVFLTQLLDEVSAKLSPNELLIIAIDALDELVSFGSGSTTNPLFLPYNLPNGVFVVLSTRPEYEFALQTSNLRGFKLEGKHKGNEQDVRDYVTARLGRDGIQTWIIAQELDDQRFIKEMWEKSQGNFMYLHHILPAIEHGHFKEGASNLPIGLLGYYKQHWARMKHDDSTLFERLYEPVVCCLAAALEPVNIELVVDWTALSEDEIRKVLRDWWEFLHQEPTPEGLEGYCLYHASFREYLENEVDPGLKKYHRMIAESGLDCIENL